MASKSKAKGNRIERLVVSEFEKFYIKAQRAWGSDGRSLGLNEEVDVVADIFPERDRIKIQVKGRKCIADYMKPDTSLVDMQVLKEDREELLAVLPLSTLLCWLEFKDR